MCCRYRLRASFTIIAGACFLQVLLPQGAFANERLFKLLDKNEDSWLVAEEIDVQHQRLFQRLLRTADEDQDDRLSLSEFQAGLQPTSAPKPLVQKQGSELPGANAVLLLLAQMDTNGNGRIEKKEVPDQLRKIFDRIENRLDSQPDGVLDRFELTQAAPKLSQIARRMAEEMDLDVDLELALLSDKQWRTVQNMLSSPPSGQMLADPKKALEFFRRFDANSDGKLSPDELPEQLSQRVKQLIQRADRNGDGQLSERELRRVSKPAQQKKGLQRLLQKFDRNKDRKISRREAPQRLAKRFNRFDTDGNGQLADDELAPVIQFLSRQKRPETQRLGEKDAVMEPAMQSE